LVFLNLPETREERLRREVRAETLSEIHQEEEKRHTEALHEARQKEAKNLLTQAVAEANARSATWYARMKEAQDKDEPFDEPPPWE